MSNSTSQKVFLDAGYGAFKYATDDGKCGEIVAHVVRAAREADLSIVGIQKGARLTHISNGFGSFLVGLGATDHPGMIEDSTDFERISDASPEVRALFYAAMTQAQVTGKAALVVALPIGLVTLPDAKQRVADMRAWMLGEHAWGVGRDKRVLTISNVKALSQAQAVYFDAFLNAHGQQLDSPEGLVLTVSIGSNTVELMGFEDGAPVARYASGSKIGVRRLLDMVNASKYRGARNVLAIDAAYRRGQIPGDVLAPAIRNWHSSIRADIKRVLGDEVERVSRVIVAGGGAKLAEPELKRLFGDRVTLAEDPVKAVVRGMTKWQAAQTAQAAQI